MAISPFSSKAWASSSVYLTRTNASRNEFECIKKGHTFVIGRSEKIFVNIFSTQIVRPTTMDPPLMPQVEAPSKIANPVERDVQLVEVVGYQDQGDPSLDFLREYLDMSEYMYS